MTTYLGIDLGGSSTKWCSIDAASGELTTVRSRPTPPDAAAVRHALEEIIAEASGGEPGTAGLRGVCIGTPGLVDEHGTILGEAVNLPGWGSELRAASLASTARVPVVVKNDTSLATLAETRVGAARGCRDVVGIFIGTGIGGGLCIDGKLYEGVGGLAGEVGHVIVEPGGVRCPCGQAGCLERYSSASGLVRVCRELASDYDTPLAAAARGADTPVTAHAIYEALKEGDPLAAAVHGSASSKLAGAIGMLINVLSPELIVLGGGVMRSGPPILEAVRSCLPELSLEHTRKRVALAQAELGVHAGAIGAALYAREAQHVPSEAENPSKDEV